MAQTQTPSGRPKPGAMTMAMQAVPVKPTGPKVLRIGLFRDKKIVEERIVRRRETVSVGTAAKNHLISQHRRETRQKRGGHANRLRDGIGIRVHECVA